MKVGCVMLPLLFSSILMDGIVRDMNDKAGSVEATLTRKGREWELPILADDERFLGAEEGEL